MKHNWLTVLLLLGPIFIIVPLITAGLFTEFVGPYYDRRGGLLSSWVALGFLFAVFSLFFIRTYWVAAITVREKFVRGTVIILAVSPLLWMLIGSLVNLL